MEDVIPGKPVPLFDDNHSLRANKLKFNCRSKTTRSSSNYQAVVGGEDVIGCAVVVNRGTSITASITVLIQRKGKKKQTFR